MRNRRGGKGQGTAPALLDQSTSPRLVRAAAEYEPRALAVPARPAARSRPGAGALRWPMAVLLPPCFFALAGVMFFGLARGTAGSLAGDGGFSIGDAALLVLLVLAAVAVFGQGFALLRRHPAARTLLKRRAEPAPEPARAAAAPYPLDHVTVEALVRAAPADLGSGSRLAAAGRTTWRTGDTLLWIVLGAISVGVAAFAAFGAGFSVWKALEGGSYTPMLIILAVFCGMAFLGLAAMARITIAAIFDRRRRKRRPAFFRVVRNGARPLSRPAEGGGRTPASGVVAVVAGFVLVFAAFWPEVTDAVGGIVDGGGPEPAAVADPTQTPTPTAQPTVATATPRPPTPTAAAANPTATATPSPTATPAATSTPTAAATISPGTATPSPTATGSPAGTPTPTATGTPTPTPTRTPTPTATATPTPTPTATPTPTPTPTATPVVDTDGDGVPNAVEDQYGSNPMNPNSTPENAAYDALSGRITCSDGLDNDLDGSTDKGGMGSAGDSGCPAP